MARIAATAMVSAGPGKTLPDEAFAGIEPDFLRSSDRISRVTLLAARAALGERTDAAEIGLVFGMDYGIYPTVATCLHRMVAEGYRFANPLEFALATPNIPHSLACVRLGLKGPNTNVSCGSLSSLAAIGMAAQFVDWGRARALLAGGASSTSAPLPQLAGRALTECAAFVLLETQGPVEVTGFAHRRLRNGSMAPLIDEALNGTAVERAIIHPGPAETMDGLPGVPASDIRELAGESLDAAGAVAVVTAAEAARQGEAGSTLIAFRDLSGREGATLVIRRAG